MILSATDIARTNMLSVEGSAVSTGCRVHPSGWPFGLGTEPGGGEIIESRTFTGPECGQGPHYNIIYQKTAKPTSTGTKNLISRMKKVVISTSDPQPGDAPSPSPPGRSFKEAFTACATSIASGVLSPSPQKRRRTTRGGVAPHPSSSGAGGDASVHRYPATPVPEGSGGRLGSAACNDPKQDNTKQS